MESVTFKTANLIQMHKPVGLELRDHILLLEVVHKQLTLTVWWHQTCKELKQGVHKAGIDTFQLRILNFKSSLTWYFNPKCKKMMLKERLHPMFRHWKPITMILLEIWNCCLIRKEIDSRKLILTRFLKPARKMN